MSNNNQNSRKYERDSSQSLELRITQDEVVENIDPSTISNRKTEHIEFNGRSYTKPLEGERDYFLIVVIVEDEHRTPQYLAPISEKILRGFIIKPIKKEKRGIPPSQMKQKAEDCEVEYGLKLDADDELYMVCDLDHYRIQLEQLHQEKKPNWNLIISNPCVELWFYYHFEKTKPIFAYCRREALYSGQMKRMCGQLKGGGGIDHTKLLNPPFDITIPITNAKDLFELEENSDFMPKLGSTQMYILMERIKQLLQ